MPDGIAGKQFARRIAEAVVIRAESARSSLNAEIEKLRLAEDRVVSDPEILSGTPVLKGTRIPVHLIAELRRQGAPVEEILAGYRGITEQDVEIAVFYTLAYPRRGAKLHTRLPVSAKLVQEQRVQAFNAS